MQACPALAIPVGSSGVVDSVFRGPWHPSYELRSNCESQKSDKVYCTFGDRRGVAEEHSTVGLGNLPLRTCPRIIVFCLCLCVPRDTFVRGSGGV